jgi:hypothetical protein
MSQPRNSFESGLYKGFLIIEILEAWKYSGMFLVQASVYKSNFIKIILELKNCGSSLFYEEQCVFNIGL